MEGQLVLISPYDPSAGFNVGHAMQRNKVIYGLSDMSLVMSSDFNRGGTWAGATEQLEHFRLVPVYVRSTGEASEGLEALRRKGAISWPNPETTEEFTSVFERSISIREGATQVGLPLPCPNDEFHLAVNSTSDFSDIKSVPHSSPNQIPPVAPTQENRKESGVLKDVQQSKCSGDKSTSPGTVQSELAPSEVLFSTVRQVAQLLLENPIGEAELASTLQVSTSQARAWLKRLIDEGIVIKHKKPMGYITKQSPLFERKN
jgi:DNA processing protein